MDDTSLFLSVTDAALSNSHLNNLSRINDWVYKWKMIVDSDIAKPAHEVSFSQKKNDVHYPSITYNNVTVKHVQSH